MTDYLNDVREVIDDERNLAIIEYDKCPLEAGRVLDVLSALPPSERPFVERFRGLGENGKPATHYIIAGDLFTLRQTERLLAQVSNIPRAEFQQRMGQLLGYSAEDISDFIGSEIARNCPCTICGRDDLAAEAAAKRTQYHA